jgi:hypothetical protein
MPQKKTPRRLITPLVLFTLAGWALWALGRNAPTAKTADGLDPAAREPEAHRAPARATWSKRRLATSLAFATIFFGGAAFSAGAGDNLVEAIEGDQNAAALATTTETTGENDDANAEEPAAEDPAADPTVEDPAAEGPTAEDDGQPADGGSDDGQAEDPAGNGGGQADDPDAPAGGDGSGGGQDDQPSGSGGGSGSGGSPSQGDQGSDPAPSPPTGLDEGRPTPANSDMPIIHKTSESSPALDPEAAADGFLATIWLHRTLPDPTPPAKRLDGAFARSLAEEADRAGVHWALLLAALRANGFKGGSMNLAPVRGVAERLATLGADRTPWRALLAYRGRATYADKVTALARYNRAVGLRALVTGLEAAKPALQKKVLADKRLDIYPGGRVDIGLGRIDVRVLTVLEYLANAHGQVTVSCLFSGHGLYARPGVVSAHIYGLAVDIAGLGNKPIYGNQEPGGLTERAVREVLLLPAELQAKQVISLLGLGGPSFPLANHDDHIHIGY